MLELVHGDVGGEVVHAVQRLVEAERERLRRGDPDEQRPGETRTGVTAIASTSGSATPAVAQARSIVGTIASRWARAGDLGYDAAEPRVLLDARGHRVGEQGVPSHQADAGLVARGLDPEDERFGRRCGHGAIVHNGCADRAQRATQGV